MKLRLIVSASALAVLAACSTADLNALRQADPEGTDFNKRIARDYLEFANFEADRMYDWKDQQYFAEKGLRANAGELVLPEKVADWSIEDEKVAEASTSRDRLIKAFDQGGREASPAVAARAQANFDCWLEQLAEGHQLDHIAACKDGFETALAQLEQDLTPEPVAAVVEESVVVAVPEPIDAIVFFDFDKADVSQLAERTIQDSLATAEGKATRVEVVGHADRAGPSSYNEALSQRRADAVRRTLIDLGMPGTMIDAVAKGESDPLIATPDGVREPQNRRVRVRYITDNAPTS